MFCVNESSKILMDCMIRVTVWEEYILVYVDSKQEKPLNQFLA
jgi:hypothetical protein